MRLSVMACFLLCSPALACDKPVYSYLGFTGPNGEPSHVWREKLNQQVGFDECRFLFHGALFPEHPDGGYDNSGPIDATKLIRRLAEIPKGRTVILNLENGGYENGYWNMVDSQGMEPNPVGIEHRADLLRFVRKESPWCRFGFYAQIPHPGDKGLCGNHRHVELHRRWLLAWKPVADEADFLVPQVYTESDWSEEFTKRYIAASIVACRDYYPRKKVYPIVWMCHYDLIRKAAAENDYSQERFTSTVVPYWKTLLETAYSLGDGVVLWGGHGFPWTEGQWWQDTKTLIQTHGRHQ